MTIARLLILTLFLLVGSITAQDDSLTFTQTAEYDIGLDCPEYSALDGTTLWVLMNNCGTRGYKLYAYDITDGSQINTDDYADLLVSLEDTYIDAWITPFGITPNGDLSIRYNDPETYASINLLISPDGEATTITSDSFDALLAEFTDYPEYSVYSPDHTRVAVGDETGFHIIDVQAEAEIILIPVEDGTEGTAFVSFSGDGQHVYIAQLNNPDDFTDSSSTLLIYDLPAGDLLHEYPLPSFIFWLNPDETYAVLPTEGEDRLGNQINTEIYVMELATGRISAGLPIIEPPAPVAKCLNNGNDVSDTDFVASGVLTIPNVNWLADSSGMVAPLSYRGEGAGGGAGCIFNYSRLRTFSFEDAG